VQLEVDGEVYWFVPFRAGPVDAPKRARMYALLEASEKHVEAAGSTIKDFGKSYEAVCAAIVAFAEALLEDNYGREGAAAIAAKVGPYHAAALMSIAREGKLPADFTTATGVANGG